MTCLFINNLSSTDASLHTYRYFHGKCSDEVCILQLHQLRPLKLWDVMLSPRSRNTLMSPIFQSLKRIFFSLLPICERHSLGNAPLNTTILISSSQGSIFTYHSSLHIISIFHSYHSTFSNPLPCKKTHGDWRGYWMWENMGKTKHYEGGSIIKKNH